MAACRVKFGPGGPNISKNMHRGRPGGNHFRGDQICRDRPHITHTKSYVQNSPLIIVIGFYEPNHDISSVFISNKTVSGAGKLRWSTTAASRYTGGVGPIGPSSFFFSQASTITAEAITMIQARTSWIFPGILHS